jgi:hypothetical protein
MKNFKWPFNFAQTMGAVGLLVNISAATVHALAGNKSTAVAWSCAALWAFTAIINSCNSKS